MREKIPTPATITARPPSLFYASCSPTPLAPSFVDVESTSTKARQPLLLSPTLATPSLMIRNIALFPSSETPPPFPSSEIHLRTSTHLCLRTTASPAGFAGILGDVGPTSLVGVHAAACSSSFVPRPHLHYHLSFPLPLLLRNMFQLLAILNCY
ncbi:hypothetical protein PIB30_071715 [Stylosanthes scabra]|uniref:Uncharacterized protein n=1 Tax=Stylosanthes scabra TaxID=79078 RepID=A0ABU6QNF7_9FABA|nr:hypothetical protein [Stylosanthes scabra]